MFWDVMCLQCAAACVPVAHTMAPTGAVERLPIISHAGLPTRASCAAEPTRQNQ